MPDQGGRERATRPEDLSRLFVERANAGDVEGLVALYEPDAVVAFPPGEVTVGSQAIRRAYQRLLADRPRAGDTPLDHVAVPVAGPKGSTVICVVTAARRPGS